MYKPALKAWHLQLSQPTTVKKHLPFFQSEFLKHDSPACEFCLEKSMLADVVLATAQIVEAEEINLLKTKAVLQARRKECSQKKGMLQARRKANTS